MFSVAVWIVLLLILIYLVYSWNSAEGFYYASKLPARMPVKDGMKPDKISYTLGGGFEQA